MSRLADLLEGWQWWLFSIAGIAVLQLIAPYQIPLLLWIATQTAVGGLTGYWLDRAMFPGARPGDITDAAEARHARYRRALLIAAGALAVAIGM